MQEKYEIATLAAGCFWCYETIFKRIVGVNSVTSGYIGGTIPNPTYSQVCTGKTGHAEAVQIEFDPNQVSYTQLLEVFWQIHDPTTLNRQGNDVGTQYRSAVFYHNDEQKHQATEMKNKLDESGVYPQPIVTEITPATGFYVAEAYHQDYYEQNPGAGYCQVIISPKLAKFKEQYAHLLK